MSANVNSLKPSRSVKRLALFCAALLVSGCASRQTLQLPEFESWESRTELLSSLRNWELSGRIAVNAGEKGFNGKLRWTQQDDTFEATVSGPLGIGTVRIESDGQSVVHTDKDGVRTELEDAEAELYYRYGWTIPVSSLGYWVLGIPDPSMPAKTKLNSDDQLATLVQGDWTVTISQYRVSGGQPMPRLLSAHNSNTRVRVVIDKWFFFD